MRIEAAKFINDHALRHVERTTLRWTTRRGVPPALLRESGLDERTTLTPMQPHRLRALIVEDLERFPDSGRAEVHRRVGPELNVRTLTRALEALVAEGRIGPKGERRWRTYRVAPDKGQLS